MLRRGYAEASKFKGYGEMTIQFDGDEVPLNLYGDDKNYKIFPDIGEEIRPDGVVFATRRLIPGLYPIQLSRRALQQYMDTDDGKIAKEENARVVSVEVIYVSISISIFVNVSMSVCQYVSMSVSFVSVCQYVSISMSVCQYLCQCQYQYVSIFVCQYVSILCQ